MEATFEDQGHAISPREHALSPTTSRTCLDAYEEWMYYFARPLHVDRYGYFFWAFFDASNLACTMPKVYFDAANQNDLHLETLDYDPRHFHDLYLTINPLSAEDLSDYFLSYSGWLCTLAIVLFAVIGSSFDEKSPEKNGHWQYFAVLAPYVRDIFKATKWTERVICNLMLWLLIPSLGTSFAVYLLPLSVIFITLSILQRILYRRLKNHRVFMQSEHARLEEEVKDTGYCLYELNESPRDEEASRYAFAEHPFIFVNGTEDNAENGLYYVDLVRGYQKLVLKDGVSLHDFQVALQEAQDLNLQALSNQHGETDWFRKSTRQQRHRMASIAPNQLAILVQDCFVSNQDSAWNKPRTTSLFQGLMKRDTQIRNKIYHQSLSEKAFYFTMIFYASLAEGAYFYTGSFVLALFTPQVFGLMLAGAGVFLASSLIAREYEEYDYQRKLSKTELTLQMSLCVKRSTFLCHEMATSSFLFDYSFFVSNDDPRLMAQNTLSEWMQNKSGYVLGENQSFYFNVDTQDITLLDAEQHQIARTLKKQGARTYRAEEADQRSIASIHLLSCMNENEQLVKEWREVTSFGLVSVFCQGLQNGLALQSIFMSGMLFGFVLGLPITVNILLWSTGIGLGFVILSSLLTYAAYYKYKLSHPEQCEANEPRSSIETYLQAFKAEAGTIENLMQKINDEAGDIEHALISSSLLFQSESVFSVQDFEMLRLCIAGLRKGLKLEPYLEIPELAFLSGPLQVLCAGIFGIAFFLRGLTKNHGTKERVSDAPEDNTDTREDDNSLVQAGKNDGFWGYYVSSLDDPGTPSPPPSSSLSPRRRPFPSSSYLPRTHSSSGGLVSAGLFGPHNFGPHNFSTDNSAQNEESKSNDGQDMAIK